MSEFAMEELAPLIVEVIGEGGEFRLYPKGTSMLPLIRQGLDSVALVSLNREPKRGDILLYRRENGQYVLHRLMRCEKDGTLCFSGDNHPERERGIARDQLLAIAIAVFREGKRVSLDCLRMRCYSRLMASILFKKTFLFARRLFTKCKKH